MIVFLLACGGPAPPADVAVEEVAAAEDPCLGHPCQVPPPAPADPSKGLAPYEVPLPDNVVAMPVPDGNPLTHAGVALGRHLFYDPLLSGNDRQACASCHVQERSFTDPRPQSVGSEGAPLPRNSMALVNLAWTAPYFWDGRVQSLEELALQPIERPDEMNQDLARLVDELTSHPAYPALFEAAFPGEPIGPDTISKALAQFLRTLVSFNSPADLVGRPDAGLTELQMEGMKLAAGGLPRNGPTIPDLCDACHAHAAGLKEARGMGLFTISEPRGNGLPIGEDAGVFELSGVEADRGRFLVPTIRNLSVTAPYMHDGRFETLEDVVGHYDDSIVFGPGLDPPLAQDGTPLRLGMSDHERKAVAAVLGAFTDPVFLEAPAFSDPGPPQ